MAIRIELLGAVSVTCDDDGPRYVESAQARMAFARLVLGRQEGVTRHELADVVWPDQLPASWKSALRSIVSRLRVFLRPVVPEATDPVVARGGRYFVLLPPDVDVDIERAESAALTAQDRLGVGELPAARRLGMEATSRVRGPFLPDQEGPWVTGVRDDLAELFVTACEITSQASAALGEHARALLLAREAIAAEPLRESAHRCLMAAHASGGNRGEALLAYQRLRRLLAEQLGVDPSPESEAAYLDLLGSATASEADAVAATDRMRRPDVPFVDRHDEMALGLEMWKRVREGRRHLVYLTGEAGTGKTHLARELGRRIAASGGLVLIGRCDPDHAVAYQPVAEVIGGLLAATPADSLPALGPQARSALAELVRLRPPTAARGLPDAGRLFPALTELLVRMASGRPLALLLDDLQWADPATVGLLGHMLRYSADARVGVVAIARDDSWIDRPLREELRRVDHAGRLARLRLAGLEPDAIADLVEAVLPGPASAHTGLVQLLHAETAGNPYMLLELLHQGRTVGTTVSEGAPVPAGIVDLVATHLARIDDRARQLIRAAALSEPHFELDSTARAAGLDERSALDALDQVLDIGLVVEVGARDHVPDEAPRYRFRHGIVRRVVQGQLSGARRLHLHDRLVAASRTSS
jgi:DNA-binding SARP family transcriptional activator